MGTLLWGNYHFLVMNDHLWGPPVHMDKFFKTSGRGQTPPILAMPVFLELLGRQPLRKGRWEQLRKFVEKIVKWQKSDKKSFFLEKKTPPKNNTYSVAQYMVDNIKNWSLLHLLGLIPSTSPCPGENLIVLVYTKAILHSILTHGFTFHLGLSGQALTF